MNSINLPIPSINSGMQELEDSDIKEMNDLLRIYNEMESSVNRSSIPYSKQEISPPVERVVPQPGPVFQYAPFPQQALVPHYAHAPQYGAVGHYAHVPQNGFISQHAPVPELGAVPQQAHVHQYGAVPQQAHVPQNGIISQHAPVTQHAPIPYWNTTSSGATAAKTSTKAKNRICHNCSTTRAPLWRRTAEGKILCNACKLYHKKHNKNRPNEMRKDDFLRRPRKKNCNGCPVMPGSLERQPYISTSASTSLSTNTIAANTHNIANNELVTMPPDLHFYRCQLQRTSPAAVSKERMNSIDA